MYAVVTAGGIPRPGEPLYEETQGKSKVMLDVAGKPMVQWVLDALNAAALVDEIIVMGLGPEQGLSSQKPTRYLPNQGSMLENILTGMRAVLESAPGDQLVVIASADVPGVNGEMVDWIIKTACQTDDDVYYNYIRREVMEKRFPKSRRTYTRLKDMDICGGDINIVNTRAMGTEKNILMEIINSRKNPFKQASLIGWDVLFMLLLRRLDMTTAVRRISARVEVKGRALECPYAEVGMDVDKPSQLALLRAALAQPQKSR